MKSFCFFFLILFIDASSLPNPLNILGRQNSLHNKSDAQILEEIARKKKDLDWLAISHMYAHLIRRGAKLHSELLEALEQAELKDYARIIRGLLGKPSPEEETFLQFLSFQEDLYQGLSPEPKSLAQTMEMDLVSGQLPRVKQLLDSLDSDSFGIKDYFVWRVRHFSHEETTPLNEFSIFFKSSLFLSKSPSTPPAESIFTAEQFYLAAKKQAHGSFDYPDLYLGIQSSPDTTFAADCFQAESQIKPDILKILGSACLAYRHQEKKLPYKLDLREIYFQDELLMPFFADGNTIFLRSDFVQRPVQDKKKILLSALAFSLVETILPKADFWLKSCIASTLFSLESELLEQNRPFLMNHPLFPLSYFGLVHVPRNHMRQNTEIHFAILNEQMNLLGQKLWGKDFLRALAEGRQILNSLQQGGELKQILVKLGLEQPELFLR